MYKVMVVDDEFIIKEWIENMIGSIDPECFVLRHDALNGYKALEVFESLSPDIVFTDIIMPIMDGVEFVKELRKRSEDVKIIVLSNYNDFQYVKETLSNGASDYLLKLEIKPADLKKLIDKTKSEISGCRKKRDEIFSLKTSVSNSMNILKEKFVHELISDGKLKSKADMFHLVFEGNKIIVLTLRIDNLGNLPDRGLTMDGELLNFALINICEETINPLPGGVVANYNTDFIIVVTLDENNCSEKYIVSLCENIKNKAMKYLGLIVSIGIGRATENTGGLRKHYEQSVMALDYCFYSGPGSIHYYGDIDSVSQQQELYLLKNSIKEILEVFKNRDYDGFLEVMRKTTESIQLCKVIHPKDIKQMLKVFLQVIEALSADISSTSEDYSQSYSRLYNMIEKSQYLQTLVSELNNYTDFLEKIIRQKYRRHSPKIKSSMEYIRNNYSRDITRSSVANFVYLNESYFSELFSKEMEQSFSDYLTSVRVDAAKELLKSSDLSILEVASSVGYSNQSYFTRLFKNITGMTPMQYKQ